MKQSFKSKAINAVITAIVRTLLGWAEEWGNDAYFFLVIGDKNCSDVAWYNTEQLSCDGALAVASTYESVAAFQDLASSVDLLNEDNLKNDEFREKFELSSPSKESNGWHSYEQIYGGKAYTEAQEKSVWQIAKQRIPK